MKSAGLPDITGSFAADDSQTGTEGWQEFHKPLGAFSAGANIDFDLKSGDTGSSGKGRYMDFRASRSSGVYGASTTVQPNSCTVKYIIKAR